MKESNYDFLNNDSYSNFGFENLKQVLEDESVLENLFGGDDDPEDQEEGGGQLKFVKIDCAKFLMTPMEERYVACMVLSGVGDAMGYHSGIWEFCKIGQDIHNDLRQMTGKEGAIEKLELKGREWIVSDDTVMHMATAEALLSEKEGDELCSLIGKNYVQCFKTDMIGRAPGATTTWFVKKLGDDGYGWNLTSFSFDGGGCGAAMRTMCIGLRYPHPEQLESLISISIESGRCTHHHPTGYLGGFVASLFTSYAIQNIPPATWGFKMVHLIPQVQEYIRSTGRDVKENLEAMDYFVGKWKAYLQLRHITSLEDDGPLYPIEWGVNDREKFYSSISYHGWGGASGHDATIIAYDALLHSNGDWKEFCLCGVLHGGDNDTTGAIGAAWFGALFGFKNVPKCHYESLEYIDKLHYLGKSLHKWKVITEIT